MILEARVPTQANSGAYFNLGFVLEHEGSKSEARQTYRTALARLNPSTGEKADRILLAIRRLGRK